MLMRVVKKWIGQAFLSSDKSTDLQYILNFGMQDTALSIVQAHKVLFCSSTST